MGKVQQWAFQVHAVPVHVCKQTSYEMLNQFATEVFSVEFICFSNRFL